MACHIPPLKKAKKQGKMPLPSLGPIPLKIINVEFRDGVTKTECTILSICQGVHTTATLTALCWVVRVLNSASISLLERRGSIRAGSSGGNILQQGWGEVCTHPQIKYADTRSVKYNASVCGTHRCRPLSNRCNGLRAHALPEGTVVEIKPASEDGVRGLGIGIESSVVEYTADSAVGMGGERNCCPSLSVGIKLGMEKSGTRMH